MNQTNMDPTAPPPASTPAPQKNNTWLIIVIVLVVLCCCCVGLGGAYWLWTNGDRLIQNLGPTSYILHML